MSQPAPLSSITITNSFLRHPPSQPQVHNSPWKLSHEPHRAALDYLKETQRYIRTIQDQGQSQGEQPHSPTHPPSHPPKIREIVFPKALPFTECSHPSLPTIKPRLVPHNKAASLTDMSIYQKRTTAEERKDYAVTKYMLTKPVAMRSTIGFPMYRGGLVGSKSTRTFVNPHIETFLNRFETRRERISLPGISLRPHN